MLSSKKKKLSPPKPKGIMGRLREVVDNEKKVWSERGKRKSKRREKTIKDLKTEEKILDQKLRVKKARDRVKAKRRESSPIHRVLGGIGAGLSDAGKSTAPTKKPTRKKKSTKKKKTTKKSPVPRKEEKKKKQLPGLDDENAFPPL